MELQEVFSKVISNQLTGKFVLRNGFQVDSSCLINWDFGFPKWRHCTCRINVIYPKGSETIVENYIYYPDGKLYWALETEFDIIDFKPENYQ